MAEHKMPEPAVWVAADTLNSPHPTCISSLAYMSQIDWERGREYVPLYAAPVAAQAVDLGQFREAVQYASRTCLHEDLAPTLVELLALIDSHSAGGQP